MGIFNKKLRQDGLATMVLQDRTLHSARVIRQRGSLPRLANLQSFQSATRIDAPLLRGNVDPLNQKYPVAAVLDYQDYQLLLVEAPDVEPAELRAAIRWRIKDLIHFHIDDAIIDVFEIPDQRHQNRNRMMYAVAAKASRIQQRAELIEEAGFQLAVVDIPEMALRNLAMLSDLEVNGVALLHIEQNMGVITVSRQGTLYLTRRWDITSRGGAGENAEWMFDQAMLEVQRSLDYYDSHFPLGPVSGIVLTPSAAQVVGLQEHLASNFPQPVSVLDLAGNLEGASNITVPGELLAIGAALRTEERAL